MPTPAFARSVAKAAAAARWDAGPACDPVKTATRTDPSAAVLPGDPFGDADRLVAALALDGDREDGLEATGHLLDVLERDPGPDLRPDRYGSGEPHLVQAVVHAHRRVADREHLLDQRREERQGQVAVGDRAAEG